MIIFDFFKKNYKGVLLIMVSAAFLFRGFVAGSDGASSWFSPWYNLWQNFFVWNTYNVPGTYAANNFTSFFLRLFYSLFATINQNPDFIQKAAWITFFVLVSQLIFRLIRKDYTQNKFNALFLTLFVIFNPIAQYYLWTKQHWAYYLVPIYFICFTLYRRYILKGDIFWLYFVALVWFLSGFAINQPAYFIPWGFCILICFCWFFFTNSSKNKRFKLVMDNFKFLLIFILLNSVYIIPLLLEGMTQINAAQNNYAGNDSLPILHDLTRMNLFHSLFDFTVGYNNTFGNQPLVLLGWSVFLIAILFMAFFYKQNLKDKNFQFVMPLTLLLILLMFFNKGLTPPFSSISEHFYSFKPFYIFRDYKDKLALAFSMVISLLAIFFAPTKKWFLSLTVCIATISFLFFATTQWLPNNFEYSNNLSYLKTANFPNNNVYRILNLPIVNYSFFYTDNPVYFGDSPLKNLFKNDVLYTTAQQYDSPIYKLKEMLDIGIVEPEFFKNFLQEYNIRYILNNRNSFVKEDLNPYAYDPLLLSNFQFIKLIQDTPKFQVYEFTNNYPRIIGKNASFKQISPVEYKVYLSHISNTEISLLDTFNSGWQIYAVKDPSASWCVAPSNYQIAQTQECFSNKTYYSNIFPSLGLFSSLIAFRDGITVEHTATNQLFNLSVPVNTWKIDAATLKSQLNKSYYTSNNDGTIDIELYIYFKPQLYFLMGFLISFVTLIFLIYYISYRFAPLFGKKLALMFRQKLLRK